MEEQLTLKQLSDVIFSDVKKKEKTPEEELKDRFSDMKKRCYNPNSKHYHNYGGRGIYICDEWLNDRSKFIKWSLSHGFRSDLSIDRIDVNGPYAPWNCRWVDSKTQANNKTTNTFMTVNGITKTLAEWTEFLKCRSRTVIYHLYWEDPADAEWFVKYMLNQRK